VLSGYLIIWFQNNLTEKIFFIENILLKLKDLPIKLKPIAHQPLSGKRLVINVTTQP
jgi:hypothetical protein